MSSNRAHKERARSSHRLSDAGRQSSLSEFYSVTKRTQTLPAAQKFIEKTRQGASTSCSTELVGKPTPLNESASSLPPTTTTPPSPPLEWRSSVESIVSSQSHPKKSTSTTDLFSDPISVKHSTTHFRPILWYHPPRTPYRHETLRGPSHVRLLRLVKHHSYFYEFDLVQFDLQQTYPRYKALLYVWGSHETRKSMPMVDGSSLLITNNLWQALCHIIDASKLTDLVWLWVDQICIWECYP